MLTYLRSTKLHHHGDCSLLGITPDLTLYVEETYGEEDWFAHHIVRADGTIKQTVDEEDGENPYVQPMKPPPYAIRPTIGGKQSARLNYTGARHRGLREPERISEAARPLTLPTRMALVDQLKLDILPPMMLGIAESYVLSEAELVPSSVYLVCRRVRIAYALADVRYDSDQQPYDYDTLTLYLAHLYEPDSGDNEISADAAFAGLPGVTLHRPMDCLTYKSHVFVAEGGTPEHLSRVHVWTMA
ncbi:MAG: hypothetical protein OHK0046_40710 [Anaerolineae bacterium]